MPQDASVELHILTPDNAKEYFALLDRNRAFFAKFNKLPADKYPDVESVARALAEPGKKRWGIYRFGLLVGMVSIKPWEKDANAGEIGYVLDEHASGEGVTTDAVKQLVMLSAKEYSAFVAEADPRNATNIRVLEKSGFTAGGPNEAGEPVYYLSLR